MLRVILPTDEYQDFDVSVLAEHPETLLGSIVTHQPDVTVVKLQQPWVTRNILHLLNAYYMKALILPEDIERQSDQWNDPTLLEAARYFGVPYFQVLASKWYDRIESGINPIDQDTLRATTDHDQYYRLIVWTIVAGYTKLLEHLMSLRIEDQLDPHILLVGLYMGNNETLYILMRQDYRPFTGPCQKEFYGFTFDETDISDVLVIPNQCHMYRYLLTESVDTFAQLVAKFPPTSELIGRLFSAVMTHARYDLATFILTHPILGNDSSLNHYFSDPDWRNYFRRILVYSDLPSDLWSLLAHRLVSVEYFRRGMVRWWIKEYEQNFDQLQHHIDRVWAILAERREISDQAFIDLAFAVAQDHVGSIQRLVPVIYRQTSPETFHNMITLMLLIAVHYQKQASVDALYVAHDKLMKRTWSPSILSLAMTVGNPWIIAMVKVHP